jgi:phosphoenolpyruvate carboxylase
MSPGKSKPLWKADDQQARLAELTARSDDPAKDNPLRRDVRSLGTVLGQVLVEQSGQELFESVEKLRQLLIEHRESVRSHPAQTEPSELMQQAQQMISKMDLTRAYHESR